MAKLEITVDTSKKTIVGKIDGKSIGDITHVWIVADNQEESVADIHEGHFFVDISLRSQDIDGIKKTSRLVALDHGKMTKDKDKKKKKGLTKGEVDGYLRKRYNEEASCFDGFVCMGIHADRIVDLRGGKTFPLGCAQIAATDNISVHNFWVRGLDLSGGVAASAVHSFGGQY